jgi:hypothetical protein
MSIRGDCTGNLRMSSPPSSTPAAAAAAAAGALKNNNANQERWAQERN